MFGEWSFTFKNVPSASNHFYVKIIELTLFVLQTEQYSLCVSYRKSATHDDEIHRLYEEMEQQIKNERERIVLQVKTKRKSVVIFR